MNEKLPIVLYVDDEKNNRLIFHHALGDRVSIRLASSAREALAQLAKEPIELVLADLRMPEMNGVELVRRIRALHPRVPCFIVTGYPDATELRGVLAERLVARIFVKPWDPEELLAAFAEALGHPPA